MGSKAIQGHLWGQRPDDWANIQEQTSINTYHDVLDKIKIDGSVKLLDIGCGSGLFSSLAVQKGATVTGIDASLPFIERARTRVP